MHGQRLSVDFAHPTPLPTPRPVIVPKPNVLPPPPSYARPNTAMEGKTPPQDPVKVAGAPTPYKRPSSAGGGNRFVFDELAQRIFNI